MQGDINQDIFAAAPVNIWNYRQNHPELVVKDCERYGFTATQQDVVRQSMLVRGVNKWLKVRRDLIAYKKTLKHDLKDYYKNVQEKKATMTSLFCTPKMVEKGEKTAFDLEAYYRARIDYEAAKQVLKVKMEVRSTLKSLCMTERWQVWQGKKLTEMNTLRASD